MRSFLHYLTLGSLLSGGLVALEITTFGLLVAWPLALVLALLRHTRAFGIRYLVAAFIWVMRGTPILLQLIFLYNVLPAWGIGLDAFWTAVIGLGLNESAFSAEIIRGGLLAVGTSQTDAAASLGYPPTMTLFRVQLPQALRYIVPTLTNEAIAMVKNTSLASVITVSELTLRSEQIVSVNFKYVPVFAASAAIYLIATSVLVLCQHYLEGALDLDRRTRRQARNRRQWLRHRPRPLEVPTPQEADTAPADSFNWLDHASGDGLFSRYREAVRRAAGRDVAADRGDGSDPQVIVQVHGLEKRFGNLTVLDNFDLSVRRGEVLCILGPSGSGKSTLLRILDGLDVASDGTVEVAGVRWVHGHQGPTGLPGRRRRVPPRDRLRAGLGLVFQRFNLFEHRTALANVMDAPTRVLGVDSDLCDEVSRTLLREVGLEGREESYPHQLSGGQQQRVAIARALALAPEVMLFDEPTSALDPELVGEVIRVMAQLAGHGMTMIVVTHEIEFARRCASRVLFMEKGVIVEEGPPEQLFTKPQQARTREFLAAITNTDPTAARTYSESAVAAEA